MEKDGGTLSEDRLGVIDSSNCSALLGGRRYLLEVAMALPSTARLSSTAGD